jgi:hypothetical protein
MQLQIGKRYRVELFPSKTPREVNFVEWEILELKPDSIKVRTSLPDGEMLELKDLPIATVRLYAETGRIAEIDPSILPTANH